MHSLQRLFVPKDRVIKAELHLEIQQLCDVPLISGTYFARWSIRDTSGTRDRGTTERAPIHGHQVTWNSTVTGTYSLVIAKDGMLMPCMLRLRICHALVGGLETETIGILRLNLAEYVGLPQASRHYLLQDSKINATLMMSICLRQVSGDIVYKIPPLNMSQINVDLSGIIKDHRQQHQRKLSGNQDVLSRGEHYRHSPNQSRDGTVSSHTDDSEDKDAISNKGMTLSRAINQHARSFSRLTALHLMQSASADDPSAADVVDAILAKARRIPERETVDQQFSDFMAQANYDTDENSDV